MKIFSLFIAFFSLYSFGQVGTGEWRMHFANRKAVDVKALNGVVYAAFEKGLLEYDIAATESSTWTKVNSLSDIDISALGICNANNSLFIGYENGNIDQIKDNKVINIPAIKLAEIFGIKRIFKIVEYKNYVYVATAFSIVKIDPLKNEVKDTFYPTSTNDTIFDVAFANDSIFALTPKKLMKSKLTNNLADYTKWKVDARVPVLTKNSYHDLEFLNDQLFLLFQHDDFGKDTVYNVKYTGLEALPLPYSSEIHTIATTESSLMVNVDGGIFEFGTNNVLQNVFFQYAFGATPNCNNSVRYDNYIWIADNNSGLVQFKDNWNAVKIEMEGPPKNQFFAMDSHKGRLLITSGGLEGISSTYNIGGLYQFENEKWNLKDRQNMNMWKDGNKAWDFVSVAINPVQKDEYAVSSFSLIPVSIFRANDQVTDTLTSNNSPLKKTSLGNGFTLVSDVKYDDKGNLWMLNGYSTNPLVMLEKDKSTFHTFSLGSAGINEFTSKLIVDQNNVKWSAVRNRGLCAYFDNGTYADKSDDKLKWLTSDENSGALPSNAVTAIAADLNNNIWIGTDNGFTIFSNSTSFFDKGPGQYNAQRVKLKFEDNVEYMLGNTYITDIEVDGANRKWLATANTGLFLMDEYGQEILQHFTKENSRLISNVVTEIEMNQVTGELFIVTDKGLQSYRTDASNGTDDYESVTVFPNPAKPDFEGLITIQGIKYNSDVKITDIAGNLIYKSTSNGGTATWDGRTVTGERVTAGVYLIWTAYNDGKGRKVGKVVVVN